MTPDRTTPAAVAAEVPPPAAVLWDLDGTLVDTEPYWIACEHELAARHGGTWSDEHAHALIGNPLPVSAAYLREHSGIAISAEQVLRELVDAMEARLRGRVPWRPGARKLLADLRASGVPCALVTMSYRNLAAAVLSEAPAGTFAAVVTGDEVTHGKPHPEPYLEAARRLGVDPAACVAFEDSLTGLASARAAGTFTVGVRNLVPLAPESADLVLDTLDGVSGVDVGRWVAGRARPPIAS